MNSKFKNLGIFFSQKRKLYIKKISCDVGPCRGPEGRTDVEGMRKRSVVELLLHIEILFCLPIISIAEREKIAGMQIFCN